jgi:hypothetical protein
MPRSHLDMIFVDRVLDLLEANLNGLTKDDFLDQYYNGQMPDSATCERTWSRFLKVELFSNSMFNGSEEGYLWIRARRALHNTFYYHAVAKIEKGTFRFLVPESFALHLHDQHTSEWKTRTKTKMRSTVAAAQQMLSRGEATNNPAAINEAEERLSEIVMVSARLASINFGDGIALDHLRRLSASPRLSLLNPQIRRALNAVERASKTINELASTVMGLKAIAQPDVRRELEQ